jgi:hypothetical protein
MAAPTEKKRNQYNGQRQTQDKRRQAPTHVSKPFELFLHHDDKVLS